MKNNILVGVHPIKEAFKENQTIDKLLVQRGLGNPDIIELANQLKDSGIPVQQVPKIKLDKISHINHQGVLAFISPIEFVAIDDILDIAEEKNEPPFVLILDSITDTRNFGAICRTAECMGVHGIIIPKTGSAPISEGTIKSSAGAVLKIKISRINHLLDAINHLRSSEVEVVACHEDASVVIEEFAPQKNGVAIIMGSEDLGISKKLVSNSDNQLKIAMYGTIGSLNVGVATGMVLYELKKKLIK